MGLGMKSEGTQDRCSNFENGPRWLWRGFAVTPTNSASRHGAAERLHDRLVGGDIRLLLETTFSTDGFKDEQ
jgi:hypothetical protein